MDRSSSVSVLVCAVLIAVFCGLSTNPVFASVNPALCRQTKNESLVGGCFTYPPVGGSCSSVIGGQLVYLAANQTVPAQEVFALTIMATLRANKGIVDDTCLRVGDAFACNTVYPSCTRTVPANPLSEGIPALPCESFCQDLWSACKVPFEQFNIGLILGTKTFDIQDFSFPHCPGTEPGVGTFAEGGQVADVFGERFIRALGAYPVGYRGQPRNPRESATYRLVNSTTLNVQCKVPAVPSRPANITSFIPARTADSCTFPLVLVDDTCVIPCPFPVIPAANQDQIGQAFVVPAIIGFIFCVFVLFDSLWVIAESQGFNRLLQLRKRLLNTNTTTDEGSNTVGGTSGSKRRRNQLRAATLYSLLGALLCITFFFVGPMITLVRKQEVSCGVDPVAIDLGNVARGTADLSDASCRAQRVAPFLLQMVFNLILYAIVRVFLVVTEKARFWDDRRKMCFDILLATYCAGIPILFMIVAMEKDKLSNNVIDFITQFSRNSAICVPRLSVADEVILVFMPFIITGVAITWLSLYIYMHLSSISKGVTGLSNAEQKQNSSAVALKLLMTRLSVLGVATFLVLLVFISASASLMQSMAEFAPKFNVFFGCQLVKTSQCKSCVGETALMLAALPSSVAFAAQIAAMSSITLLFGGFFAAQSFARLYKEYQDGTLQIKLGNFVHGRPIGLNKKNMMESSMHSFSQMNEKLIETKEAVKESCLAIWYGRYKEWRNSVRGRARGPVFRWQKNQNTDANTRRGNGKGKDKKKFDFVPRSWNSKKDNKVGDGKWQGVVGGMQSQSEDSSAMTSSSSAMWKTSMSQTNGVGANGYNTQSWAAPNNPMMGAWNAGFAPSESAPRSPGASVPKVIVIEDEDDDQGMGRRPPSRCPSI